MTVLHLSSAWPTGLSILLSAGAAELIDDACYDSSGITSIDTALLLGCEEGVALLFDAGCYWDHFEDVTLSGPVSVECIQTVARKLADRRRRLMSLAKDTLPEVQLGIVRQTAGVLDSDAAVVVRLLREAGVDIPRHLTVPDRYKGVYRTAKLDITYFPIFFVHGFKDLDHQTRAYPTPLQTARLDSYSFTSIPGKGPLAPGLFQWLETHGCLATPPTDDLPPGTNKSATGYHILASRLVDEGGMYSGWLKSASFATHELATAGILGIFASGEADHCRCACSSTGCLPLTAALKFHPRRNVAPELLPLSPHCYFNGLWEALPESMAGEVLRFLTFEALEMTHTCCAVTIKHPPHCPYPDIVTLQNFGGAIDEIHDEEEELHRRLEELLVEFHAQFVESGAELREFLNGYWRSRMADECVPVWDRQDVVGRDSGVNFEKECESTHRKGEERVS